MPTVLRVGPYRFFFYSQDGAEPAHIHVERDRNRSKFWLDPVRLQDSGGYRSPELVELPRWFKNIVVFSLEPGMSSSARELLIPPLATSVTVTDESLVVELNDGRTLTVPLVWFPRLQHGTQAERAEWRLIGHGEGVHWSALDEDIEIEGLLAGRGSNESQASLKKWLINRGAT